MEVINELDLSMVKKKLMDPEEGEGWTAEFADKIIEEYRRFLYLTKKYKKPIVPSKLVDTVWHNHILDTHAYGPDCQKVFGEFLHHFPYWGMRGEKDLSDLQNAWHDSINLYQNEFGRSVEQDFVWQEAARCPKCGRI
jgi:hypothetical protein